MRRDREEMEIDSNDAKELEVMSKMQRRGKKGRAVQANNRRAMEGEMIVSRKPDG